MIRRPSSSSLPPDGDRTGRRSGSSASRRAACAPDRERGAAMAGAVAAYGGAPPDTAADGRVRTISHALGCGSIRSTNRHCAPCNGRPCWATRGTRASWPPSPSSASPRSTPRPRPRSERDWSIGVGTACGSPTRSCVPSCSIGCPPPSERTVPLDRRTTGDALRGRRSDRRRGAPPDHRPSPPRRPGSRRLGDCRQGASCWPRHALVGVRPGRSIPHGCGQVGGRWVGRRSRQALSRGWSHGILRLRPRPRRVPPRRCHLVRPPGGRRRIAATRRRAAAHACEVAPGPARGTRST